jgi:hypothetical protein
MIRSRVPQNRYFLERLIAVPHCNPGGSHRFLFGSSIRACDAGGGMAVSVPNAFLYPGHLLHHLLADRTMTVRG